MFGKRLSEYVGFEWALLLILALVGLARLILSIAGLPNSAVRWVSMNAVVWAGAIYCGIAVFTRGFGSYKQLLPLVFLQALVFNAMVVLGILLAIGGVPNIFAAPEYSPPGLSQWIHALIHLTAGIVVPSLLLWGVASLTLLITKKVARRPALA